MHTTMTALVIIGLTFTLAGFVKGVTGMGLPTVAVGMLGLVMPPAEAVALLVVPSLVTNVWQFASLPNRLVTLRRLWPMVLGIAVATLLSAGLISGETWRAAMGLGAVLIIYGLVGLARIEFRVAPRFEPWAAPIVGLATGVVTGATGVLVIPAVPYLQALGLARDDLVQALGLSFTASTMALAAGLAEHGLMRPGAIGLSLACTLPALLGMAVGGVLRRRINPVMFRTLFFVALILLGADIVFRSYDSIGN